MFTWLSQQAHGWEKYKFINLELIYVPSNAVTTTPGSLFLAADYDAEDPVPDSLQRLSTFETQASGKVYDSIRLKPPNRRLNDVPGHKFIRDTPVAANLSLYDPCSIILATVDCESADPLGQLWVNYEVELVSPQSQIREPIAGGLAILGGAASSLVSTVSEPLHFTSFVSDSLGVEPVTGTWSYILPKGIYEVVANVNMFTTNAIQSMVGMVSVAIDDVVEAASSTMASWTSGVASSAYTMMVRYIVTTTGTQALTLVAMLTGAGTLSAVAPRLSIRSLDR